MQKLIDDIEEIGVKIQNHPLIEKARRLRELVPPKPDVSDEEVELQGDGTRNYFGVNMKDKKTKSFGIKVLLSVTTGRLLEEIGTLYEILGWMTDDVPFTHQLPRFMDECAPWLLQWFPELAEFGTAKAIKSLDARIKLSSPKEAIDAWIKDLSAKMPVKDAYDVPKIPRDDHAQIGPVEELEAMTGKKPIVVTIPTTEAKD